VFVVITLVDLAYGVFHQQVALLSKATPAEPMTEGVQKD